jgi:myo-inositol 2-dehydrogenase/D-chiro-inositol 1-dehydrogenase
MPGNEIVIGVLGCGGIASYYHLPILAAHPSVRIVAVADPAPGARERARAIVPEAAAEADPRAVLARADVDAVVVCAESGRHADLACAAAEAGKHLYVEKPLAVTLADGRAAVAAVRAAQVSATMGFNLRSHPLHQQAHGLLGDGAVGQVRAVRAIFHEPARGSRMPEWKRRRATGGGALLDLASHTVDLLRWHLGGEVAGATATLASQKTEHDSARLRITMASGVEADLDCRLGTTRADVFEVEGTLGTMRIDRYGDTLSLVGAPQPLKPLKERIRGRLALRPSPDPSFRLALGAWIDGLLGADVELPTLDDGLKSLEVVLAAEQTAG